MKVPEAITPQDAGMKASKRQARSFPLCVKYINGKLAIWAMDRQLAIATVNLPDGGKFIEAHDLVRYFKKATWKVKVDSIRRPDGSSTEIECIRFYPPTASGDDGKAS